MNFRKSIAILSVAGLSLALAGCGGKENVGHFNSARVMAESPVVQKLMDEGRQKIQAVSDKLIALEAQRTALGEEEFRRQAIALEREAQETQEEQVQVVRAKIEETLAEIATAKKLDAVMTNDGRMVHFGGVDVTDEMIGKLQDKTDKTETAEKAK